MCFFQDNIFLIIFSVFFSEEKIDNILKFKDKPEPIDVYLKNDGKIQLFLQILGIEYKQYCYNN